MLLRLEIQKTNSAEFNVMRTLTAASKDTPEYEKAIKDLREQREMWSRDYYRGRRFQITCDGKAIE